MVTAASRLVKMEDGGVDQWCREKKGDCEYVFLDRLDPCQ